MSIYDNFRAPQYVDFAGIRNGDLNSEASSFFDRDTDVDLTPLAAKSIFSDASVTSFNGTFSDGDATLTPSKFSSSINKFPGDSGQHARTPHRASISMNIFASPSSKSEVSTFDVKGSTVKESPSFEAFNIPSNRISTPLVRDVNVNTQVETKASPLRKSTRFTDNLLVSSPSGKTPKPTVDASGGTLQGSRKSRCSGVAPLHKRRSRSATTPKSTDEILEDAIQALSINSNKKTLTGAPDDVDQCSSPALLNPKLQPVVDTKLCSKLGPSGKEAGPKRKLSPPPKNAREQPAKYISMAEQVAQIQKQTPKRFRTLPSAAGMKKGTQLSVVRNLSSGPKPARVASGGSASVPSGPEKKLKQQEGSSSDSTGVRVARWPKPKVEPFVFTQYKKKDLPKTVFNFEQKQSVILRDRKTPCLRRRQTTKTQPFSFDKRDQELLQRKVNRIMGAETQSHCCQTKARRRSRSQGDEHCRNLKDPLVHHARAPTVLHKPPFVPQKKPQKVTRPIDFCLNTEKRAKEREEFDGLVKQKEMERLTLLNQLQEEKRLEEEKEIQRLRKEMVHKARPVPVFHPFTIQPSDAPLTDPSTPNFLRHSKPSHGPKLSQDAMET